MHTSKSSSSRGSGGYLVGSGYEIGGGERSSLVGSFAIGGVESPEVLSGVDPSPVYSASTVYYKPYS